MTRILIVDDDQVNRMLLSACLKDIAEISHASDGRTAITLCQNQPPDLVLLDLMMPHISGVNVSKRMRKMHVPVVIVTATNDIDLILRALRSGAVGFLSKPFDAASVRATVFVALETVRRLNEIGLRGATGKMVHEAAGILERHSSFTSRSMAIEYMQQTAKQAGITVPEYAQQIIAAAALLNGAPPPNNDPDNDDLGY